MKDVKISTKRRATDSSQAAESDTAPPPGPTSSQSTTWEDLQAICPPRHRKLSSFFGYFPLFFALN